MREKEVRYFRDEVHDDFAATNGKIDRNEIDGSYPYFHGVCWRIASFLLYRFIITPIVYLWVKIWFGITVKNRKAITSLKTGCFLYLNHTQDICDAFIPTIASFYKRAYVITGPEAVSIKGIRQLVAMLGAIPLPSTFSAAKNYEKRLKEAIKEKAAVTIYPEAHIWPYCNFVRDFPDTSFSYPVRLGAPAVAGVTVYRKRKIFRSAHPKITLYLSDPIYPEKGLSEKAARRKMRDEAFFFMSDTAKREKSYAYITYKKIEDEKNETKIH